MCSRGIEALAAVSSGSSERCEQTSCASSELREHTSRASRRAALGEREGNGLRGQGNDGLRGNGCLQGNGGLGGNEMPFGQRRDPGVRTSRVK